MRDNKNNRKWGTSFLLRVRLMAEPVLLYEWKILHKTNQNKHPGELFKIKRKSWLASSLCFLVETVQAYEHAATKKEAMELLNMNIFHLIKTWSWNCTILDLCHHITTSISLLVLCQSKSCCNEMTDYNW